MTNNNEWISEKVLEFVDGGMDAADSSSYISVHLPGLLKECRSETVREIAEKVKELRLKADSFTSPFRAHYQDALDDVLALLTKQ